MDRNEYNFKIEEMRVAVRNKDYERAVQIADSLDYRREKANDILSLIAMHMKWQSSMIRQSRL